jgi:glycosyltransferase involved in cell wall biosynthesis
MAFLHQVNFATGTSGERWSVDFSVALENRTGKYFLGRDIIADNQSLIADVRYWRGISEHADLQAGIGLRYGLKVEKRLYAYSSAIHLPPRRASRRTLYLDPFTVIMADLAPNDIVLCHDLGPLTHPELFTGWLQRLYERVYAKIARVRPRMVFVSSSTQREFERLVSSQCPMSVIYPHLRADIDDRAQTAITGSPPPFFLTVGSLGRRKNQLTAIRAFARSGLAAFGARYALCGAHEPGWEAVVEAAAITPGVDLLPYVSDSELAWLYAQAKGFILPSRLEGFGMPVAEAIGRGLVPIISENSVLEEVAGEGAITVDPEDEAQIARAMTTLWNMSHAEFSARTDALLQGIGRFTRESFSQKWRLELSGTPMAEVAGMGQLFSMNVDHPKSAPVYPEYSNNIPTMSLGLKGP